jgi:hypothetical protein
MYSDPFSTQQTAKQREKPNGLQLERKRHSSNGRRNKKDRVCQHFFVLTAQPFLGINLVAFPF